MNEAGILLLFTAILTGCMIYDRVSRMRGHLPGLVFNGIFVTALVSAIVVHACMMFGVVPALLFLFVVTVIPYLIEAIGLRTGLPFGNYQYAEKLGPQFPLGVPVAVVGIWPVALYYSFLSAMLLTDLLGIEQHILLLLCLSSAIAVLADVMIEPITVDNGYWTWSPQQPFGRFKWRTIPLLNYFGWFITAFVALYVAINFIAPRLPMIANDNPFFYFSRLPIKDPVPAPVIARWLSALPMLWAGLAAWYTIGEAQRIARKDVAMIARWIAIIAFGLYAFYIYLSLPATPTSVMGRM